MKTLHVLIGVFSIIAAPGYATAQTAVATTAGLYLTADDFSQHKLTYPIDCNNPKDKMVLNEFFESSTGYIISNSQKHAFFRRHVFFISNSQKHAFDKSKVYGYCTCKNKNYRFYNKTAYQILDAKDFYIYYRFVPEEHVKGKSLVKTDEYYFSIDGNETIQPLTRDNLRKVFPNNHRFHYALDASFSSDKELVAYDNFLKTYKIKYLYSESLK